VSVAAHITCQRRDHGVPHAVSCRALGVSPSWYYKWRDRPATSRQVRRAQLTEKITKSFADSGATYGSPRVVLDLRADGEVVSVNTVAKIMRERCLVGRALRHRHGLTRPGRKPACADQVRRGFDAVAPNVLWCGDLTEIVTGEGRLYLATTLDLFSRRVLGHAMGEHHDADLAVASLQMAAARRGGNVDGVIFHSDRGGEYTAAAFEQACGRLGVTQSMARVGSCLDNACAEAFNSTIKVEYVYRQHFPTKASAIEKITNWINGFYNTRRRHSAAGGMSPIDFEEFIAEARRASTT
jgi:transposase InsO family protein